MKEENNRSRLRFLAALPLGILGISAKSNAQHMGGNHPQAAAHQAQLSELLTFKQDAEARFQITETLHRYARGWDRRDEAALRACFHPDSTHEHGTFNGLSQDFVTGGLKSVAAVRQMTHMISNIMIEIDGDQAISECYFLAHHRRPASEGDGLIDWFLKGRYLDRHEKRDGEWRISHRRGLSDFARTFDPADSSLDAAPAEQLSHWKPDDPLYSMLSDFGAN